MTIAMANGDKVDEKKSWIRHLVCVWRRLFALAKRQIPAVAQLRSSVFRYVPELTANDRD